MLRMGELICILCRILTKRSDALLASLVIISSACFSFWTMWNLIRMEHQVGNYQIKRISNLIPLQGVVRTYDMHICDRYANLTLNMFSL